MYLHFLCNHQPLISLLILIKNTRSAIERDPNESTNRSLELAQNVSPQLVFIDVESYYATRQHRTRRVLHMQLHTNPLTSLPFTNTGRASPASKGYLYKLTLKSD